MTDPLSEEEDRLAAQRRYALSSPEELPLREAFLASLSHELRTPLNGMLGMSEALGDGVFGPLSAPQREALARVLASGRTLRALVDDLLDLAKIQAGQLALDVTRTDLGALSRRALEEVRAAAAEKRQRLSLRVDADLDADLDARRMNRVLVSLLDNAVKFTREGGAISLEVDAPTRDAVEFRVRDDGIGIAAEHHALIFQVFTQVDGQLSRTYRGTGLGLALVRHLVDLHGGSVAVTSELDRGSSFCVRVPRGRSVAEGR